MIKNCYESFIFEQYNSPFDDSHLLVKEMNKKELLLFDMGHIDNIPTKQILKIKYVFITHMHMDHFCGFQSFLRQILRLKNTTITFFGPKNLSKKIAYSVQAFEWNLVDDQAPLFEIYEISKNKVDYLKPTLFHKIHPNLLKNKKNLQNLGNLAEISFNYGSLEWCILDHKIDSLGFKIKTPSKLKVKKEAIQSVPQGDWIKKAQKNILLNKNLTELIKIDDNLELTLKQVENRFFTKVPSSSFAYITDFIYNSDTSQILNSFLKNIGFLFIESHFLKEDQHLAQETYHLSTKDVAKILSKNQINNFILTHFSQRYTNKILPDFFYVEVKESLNL